MAARPQRWKPLTPTAHAVVAADFKYEPAQDIIFSRLHALQRLGGYSWAYDVASPSGKMIIDCEPIYFTSGGRKWMIELWKGQYGLETGAEIGLYNRRDTSMPNGSERWALYRCANNQEIRLLKLSFTLRRDGRELFRRGPEHHWWLTGFKWGVFTDPTSSLTMDVAIEFLPGSDDMRRGFLDGLTALGYRPATTGGSVFFQFERPKTPQPATRLALERPVQEKNRKLVHAYVALREELGLPNNDPNGFDIPHLLGSAPRPEVNAHAAGRVAQRVVRHVDGKAAARARHRIKHDASEQRSAHEIFAFFHDKVWHNTQHPRATS